MNPQHILQYINEKLQQGLTLAEVSILDGKNKGYYSNYCKRHKLIFEKPKKTFTDKKGKRRDRYNIEKVLDETLLLRLIHSGNSAQQISKVFECSFTHVKNVVKWEYSTLYTKLIENGIRRRNTSAVGRTNKHWKNRKGKTYEEIYGPEKAVEMRNKRREWLKNNNIRKFATRVSKPQAMLFEIVKKYYPTAVLEQDIKLPNERIVWLDIAIPEQKICIEYDGIYWHKINQNNTRVAVKDKDRDKMLKEMGWSVYRIQSEKNPSEAELKEMFFDLQLLHD